MKAQEIRNVYITKKLTQDDRPVSKQQLNYIKSLCRDNGNEFPFTIREANQYIDSIRACHIIHFLKKGYKVVFIIQLHT